MMGNTGEDPVLARLRREAEGLHEEVYPGDLMEDIRPRLRRRPGRLVHRWVPVAATLALAAAWMFTGERRGPQPQPMSSLSAFTSPPGISVGAIPLTVSLSPTPPRFGRALGRGVRSLSNLRPPLRRAARKEKK